MIRKLTQRGKNKDENKDAEFIFEVPKNAQSRPPGRPLPPKVKYKDEYEKPLTPAAVKRTQSK